MPTEQFTHRELELLFKRIDEKLDDIRQDIKETNNHLDMRLTKVERKVEKMETWHTKIMAIWGVVVTAAGYVVHVLISRFLQ